MTEHLIDDELAEQDLLACAARVAETIDNLEGHAEAITNVATRYADAGQIEFAVALIETIGDPYTRDRALAETAVKAAESGQEDYALQLLQTIEDPSFQAQATSQIAVKRAEAGDYDGAATLARELPDASSTLAEIAVKCAGAGHVEEALELISSIEYNGSAASALAEAATAETKAGRTTEASELLSQALAEAETIELAEDRASMLVMIGLRYGEAGEQQRAEELLTEAARVAETVELANYRDGALGQTGMGLARTGLDERALEVAAQIEDPFHAAAAHVGIAAEQLRAGRSAEVPTLLARALELATDEESFPPSAHPASKYHALTEIANLYAEAGLSDEAARTIGLIDSERDKDAALLEVAKACMRAANTDEALRLARMIEDPVLKTRALTTLAAALLQQNEQQERALSLLSEATRTAEEIRRKSDRTQALIEIAGKYSATERATQVERLLLQALEITREIESRDELSASLARLSDAFYETGTEIDERVAAILREIVVKLD